jgi:hypothetical protein
MATGRINPGQRLANAISARAWNRAQDAADIILRDRASLGVDGQNAPRSLTDLVVRNDSGFAVSMLGVLSLTSPVISPVGGDFDADEEADARAREFFRSPVLIGVTPTANSPRFGIAVEPIKKDAVGRVAVAGVVACNVFCNKSWHSYAAQKNGESILESSPFGNIQILCWHTATNEFTQTENINSVRTALVRLGNTTPCQLVVINFDAPGGIWKRYTTQNVVLPSGSSGVYKTGRKTGWSQQPASIGFPPNYLVVRNVLADIRQSGQGVVAPWGDEWLLINWSPASFTVEQRTGESKEIAVPTYTTPGTPPTLQQP